MKLNSFAWALAASCSVVVNAIGAPRRGLRTVESNVYVAYPGATFEQLIDHTNRSLGTFSQRYWYNTEYWKGPGSPIVITTPGESDAASSVNDFCSIKSLNGVIAQKIGAATIVIEHRYWGKSSPYDELTTANLQYLTVQNSIEDLTYFARNVQLPFATSRYPSNAQNVPWVLIGGSYSGALTAWTAKISPGTFWAYLATSAVVEAISDFWQYYAPIQQAMPRNCSTDVTRVIDHLDRIMTNGTIEEISAIKAEFGLANVEHNDDFMDALAISGPNLWQTEQAELFEFCDYIEISQNTMDPSSLPGPNGVGLKKALKGYAEWQRLNPTYTNTHDASGWMYTDVSVANDGEYRQWMWMQCNQPLGLWQNGAPTSHPTIVSRLLDVKHWTRQCGLYFPRGPQGQSYGIALGQTEADTNAYTGGWSNVNTTRLMYVNGEFDPYRDSTVSSVFRPGGPFQGTEKVPLHLIPGGVHCTDLSWSNGNADPHVRHVQHADVEQISKWVKEYPEGGLSQGDQPC